MSSYPLSGDFDASVGLVGMLRTLLRSALPARRKAWLMVSILRSPAGTLILRLVMLVGLPSGFRRGLSSMPFMLPGLLVGGLVSGPPWLDTGDRMGEGDRYPVAGREVSPT